MSCLVHNSHYRSLFHAVVNELRKEKRTAPHILRSMPHSCCTCKDIDKLTLMSVLIHDKDELINLKKLVDQIDREKQNNPKLVLSLNRLENFIKENRGLPLDKSPIPTVHSTMSDDDSSSSSWEEHLPMDTGKRILKKKTKKPSKPLKNGTFLFLPYQFDDKPHSKLFLETAKKLQRGRFIGRNGYIASVEKQHDACINMLTSTTTEQVTQTLKNAKEGIGKVVIHNPKDLSEEDDGEWILVREKKKDKTKPNATDFETLLEELKNRWDSFLKIKKRKHEEEEENEETSNKKS